MKRIYWILTFALLFQSQARSQDNSDTANKAAMEAAIVSPWFLGISLGASIPSEQWDPNFPLGGGGVLSGGYRLNTALALQLDLNPWFYTGGGDTLTDSRIFCDLRVSFPSKGYVTYFLIGPGYDVQVANNDGYNTSTLAGNLGLGAQFDIHSGEHIFIEGRYDILFYKNLNQQDVPILFGLMEDL